MTATRSVTDDDDQIHYYRNQGSTQAAPPTPSTAPDAQSRELKMSSLTITPDIGEATV